MFKKSLVLVILLFTVGNINSADDTISQWTYQYMKKINGYISEENWVEAKRELEIFENFRTLQIILLGQNAELCLDV